MIDKVGDTMIQQIMKKIPPMKRTILVLKVLSLCTKDEEKIHIMDFLEKRINELETDSNKYMEVKNNKNYQ